MASSSLIFGGLSLWHSRQKPDGLLNAMDLSLSFTSIMQYIFDWLHHAFFQLVVLLQEIDPRTYAWLMSTLCMLVLLAYSTSPSDASFRSYLTELSLHRHLHQLRQDYSTPLDTSSEEQLDDLTKSESERTSTPHILTFANRISVSLRTPRYERSDYGIFCTVTVPCTPLQQGGCSHRQSTFSMSTRYVGLFGKWWIAGQVKTPARKTQKDGKEINGRAHDIWGVLRMKTGDANEDNDDVVEKAAVENRSAPLAGTQIKVASSTQGPEAVVSPGGKPSGRRKKQSNKAKPLHLLAGSEAIAAAHRVGDESGTTNGSALSRQAENQEKIADIEQQHSPPVSASAIEAGGNADLQSQLEQVRLTSESSKKLLQAQLEEFRTRKRDEDAARLDVKGRMKTLDESKRQAEGTKREAERRLKAANGLRENLENRIEGKVQEMKDWKARESASEIKVQQSGERKTSRIAEMKKEIQSKEEESHEAEAELDHLRAKLETVQHRLLEEEANYEAARELAAERDAAAMANRGYTSQPSSLYHNTYPLLSGPGEHSIGDVSLGSLQQHADWNTAYNTYGPSPNHRMAIANEGMREDLDEKFDPTIAPRHVEPPHSGFSPFAYDHQPAFHLEDIHPPAPSRILGEGANVPPSPFTSDLLPSNLFQNADDDEKHVGVLPGTRSEQVEAALNRFGLDTSDTSDAGGSGDDTAEEEGEDKEDDEAADKELSRSGNFRSAARTWWNSRGRNASKDRNTSGALSSSNESRISPAVSALEVPVTDQEASKRRSMSIFPKLSLNPGAKSFRGSNKKVVDESGFIDYNDASMQSANWNSSTGQLPTGQDFEIMKRAFQTNNLGAAVEDDDEGRRSWSAFDTWQQKNSSGPLSAFSRPTTFASRAMNGSMYHNSRASSESLQPIRRLAGSSTSPQGVNWLDDVLLPLQKCHSIDDAITSSTSSSFPRNSLRHGKPSRFAFWSKDNQQSSALLPSSSSQEIGAGDEAASSQTPQVMEAALPSTTAPPQPSKRTSFRWSRRSESSSVDVQAIPDDIRE